MLQTLLFSVLIIAFCMMLLCARLFFKKPFIHTHVSQNKALRNQKIYCVQAQDKEAREKRPLNE